MIILVILLSTISNPPDPISFESSDKLKHLLAYAVLMGWFGQLYTSIEIQLRWVISFILMGITLEFVQGLGGYRMFEIGDMLANTLGVLLGWWLTRNWCAGWLSRLDRAITHA